MEMQTLVMPGDKIGVEEEFVVSDNAYVDNDGSIRSSIMGAVTIKDGRISVVNMKHDVRRFKRGMLVLGTVSDDLRSVMFVKLDNIHVNGVEYIALKDGKIVSASARRPMGGRDFHSRDSGPPPKKTRTASVGDVILAKIIYEDQEIFTLGIDENETGVVYAECELCSSHLEVDKDSQGMLSCPKCMHKEERKISSMYGKHDEIRKLFI